MSFHPMGYPVSTLLRSGNRVTGSGFQAGKDHAYCLAGAAAMSPGAGIAAERMKHG